MTDKLAKSEFNALATSEGRSVAEMINVNTGGQGLSESDIKRLSIPAGGGVAWEIPTITGEEVVKDLHCVILGFNDHRIYYPGEYTGDNKPPRCTSKNLHTGQWVENYDDEIDEWATEDRQCSGCPMNQWGSKGRGKACSERRLMLVLTPISTLPFLIDVSPGSMKNVKSYFNDLIGASKVYFEGVTNMRLTKAESGGGIVYSQISPQWVRDLSDEEMLAAKEMRDALAPALAETAPVVEGAPF